VDGIARVYDIRCVTTATAGYTVGGASQAKATPIMALRGHRDVVRTVAYSGCGKTLATGSYDQSTKVWSTSTGTLRTTLKGHTERLQQVTFGFDRNCREAPQPEEGLEGAGGKAAAGKQVMLPLPAPVRVIQAAGPSAWLAKRRAA